MNISMNEQNKNLFKISWLPVINKLDPDSTLRDKSSTKTLPVGVTTWKQIFLIPSDNLDMMRMNGKIRKVNFNYLDTSKLNMTCFARIIPTCTISNRGLVVNRTELSCYDHQFMDSISITTANHKATKIKHALTKQQQK